MTHDPTKNQSLRWKLNLFLFNCEPDRIDQGDFKDNNFENDRQPETAISSSVCNSAWWHKRPADITTTLTAWRRYRHKASDHKKNFGCHEQTAPSADRTERSRSWVRVELLKHTNTCSSLHSYTHSPHLEAETQVSS